MSDEESKEVAQASTGVNQKTLIMIVAGVAMLFILGVGIAFYFMKSMQASPETHVDTKNQEEHQAGEAVIYIDIRPEFVVNFNGKDRQHFLQLSVTFSTVDSSMSEKMRAHMPLIRNSMVMLFGGQSYEEMKSPEGKNSLRSQILESAQKILEKEVGAKGVEQVYFTSFVMQ